MTFKRGNVGLKERVGQYQKVGEGDEKRRAQKGGTRRWWHGFHWVFNWKVEGDGQRGKVIDRIV